MAQASKKVTKKRLKWYGHFEENELEEAHIVTRQDKTRQNFIRQETNIINLIRFSYHICTVYHQTKNEYKHLTIIELTMWPSGRVCGWPCV